MPAEKLTGSQNIAADVSAVMTYKCTGCGAEVTVNTENAMTARCHWCRHVFGVNEQIANVRKLAAADFSAQYQKAVSMVELQRTMQWLHETMLRSMPVDVQKSLLTFNR